MVDGLHNLVVVESCLAKLEVQVPQSGTEILYRRIGLYDPKLSSEQSGKNEFGFVVRTSRLLQHGEKSFVLSLVELEIVVVLAWIGTTWPSFTLLYHCFFSLKI